MDRAKILILRHYFSNRQRKEYTISANGVVEYRGFRIHDLCYLVDILKFIDSIEYPINMLPMPIAEEISIYMPPTMTAINYLRARLYGYSLSITMIGVECHIALDNFAGHY